MAQLECKQPPFKLTVDMLQNINLANYPKNRTHYLVYALQFGLKLPSVKSMERCDSRNNIKSTPNIISPKTRRIAVRMIRHFKVPQKYGSPVVKLKLRRKSVLRKVLGPKRIPFRLKPISLPSEKLQKTKKIQQSKKRQSVFRICSPDRLILKAERLKFMDEIEKERLKNPGIPSLHKSTPLYFIKKKASQKRRRLEKHKLIEDNKEVLGQIFGNAIFRTGWPVSRKEIKLALGIKEEDHNRDISLGEFMKMAQCTSSFHKIKNRLQTDKGSNSRMIKIGRTTEEKVEIGKMKKGFVHDSDDFPSLLNL